MPLSVLRRGDTAPVTPQREAGATHHGWSLEEIARPPVVSPPLRIHECNAGLRLHGTPRFSVDRPTGFEPATSSLGNLLRRIGWYPTVYLARV